MKRKRISLSNPKGRALHKELVDRYSRQMLIPQVGISGQLKISDISILIVGVGGIGSTVATYLAGAGVGKLTLIDFDKVEKSNLHRQIIHQESFIGQNKVDSALHTLQALNSSFSIQYDIKSIKINHNNAMELIQPHDIIIDATDNLAARYLISDACALLKKPLVSGSAVGLDGQITVLCGETGPCYRCLHPLLPASATSASASSGSCSDAGVLGPVPGLIGCLQAMEAIKLILILNTNINRNCDDVETSICMNTDTAITENNTSCNIYNGHSSTSSASSSASTQFQSLINRQCFYDGITGTFHEFELEGKNDTCMLCGQTALIIDMVTSKMYSIDSSCSTLQCQINDSNNAINGLSTSIKSISPYDYYQRFKHFYNIPSDCPVNHIGNLSGSISTSATVNNGGSSYYHILLDVRNDVQFNMISFNYYSIGSTSASSSDISTSSTVPCKMVIVNLPLPKLLTMNPDQLSAFLPVNEFSELIINKSIDINNSVSEVSSTITLDTTTSQSTSNHSIHQSQNLPNSIDTTIYVLCRRGIASKIATEYMVHKLGFSHQNVINIEGGIDAWRQQVDSVFPEY